MLKLEAQQEVTMDQAVIDDAKAKIDAARAEFQKASNKCTRVIRAQEKRIKAEYAKQPMTLALALEPYLAGDHAVENGEGHNFINDLTWNGAWKDSGLMAMGGYWSVTMQQVIKVGIKAVSTDVQLDKLEQLIRSDALPVIRPGALSEIDPAFKDAKAIDIFEDDCCETRHLVLLYFPDDHVEIVDQRYYRPSSRDYKTQFKGTLRDALAEIRGNYSYN
jgi:hypothetical protein